MRCTWSEIVLSLHMQHLLHLRSCLYVAILKTLNIRCHEPVVARALPTLLISSASFWDVCVALLRIQTIATRQNIYVSMYFFMITCHYRSSSLESRWSSLFIQHLQHLMICLCVARLETLNLKWHVPVTAVALPTLQIWKQEHCFAEICFFKYQFQSY